MRIALTSIFVDDQQKALEFYTQKLGFVKINDHPMGEHRWLTVAGPDGPEGVELLLEPNNDPVAQAYQQGLKAKGKPCTSFEVDDVKAEVERLRGHGVLITLEPVEEQWGGYAMFDDSCGNIISIHSVGI
ncbi:VOC family protein [bacterium]|nr:VOC family protein [bacterium]